MCKSNWKFLPGKIFPFIFASNILTFTSNLSRVFVFAHYVLAAVPSCRSVSLYFLTTVTSEGRHNKNEKTSLNLRQRHRIMGNYASKDGSDDANNVHDSIPSRNNAGGASNNIRAFRAEQQAERATDEQTLVLEGDMDNSVIAELKLFYKPVSN